MATYGLDMMAFSTEHPKLDQNPKLTLLCEPLISDYVMYALYCSLLKSWPNEVASTM